MFCITDRERIYDPVTRKSGQLFRQPYEPFCLALQADCLKSKGGAVEVAANDLHVWPEHFHQIVDYPIIRRGGSCQQPEIWRQVADDAFDQSVVWAKIMAPVRDAMCLIDHEEGYLTGKLFQYLGKKILIGQPLCFD